MNMELLLECRQSGTFLFLKRLSTKNDFTVELKQEIGVLAVQPTSRWCQSQQLHRTLATCLEQYTLKSNL